MRNVSLIFCRSENFVIGQGNTIPWKYKGEQKRFKELTENNVVVMGRKTWESLPESKRPLPNRINVLITSSREYYPVEYQYSSVDDFMFKDGIRLASEGNHIWFIGGRQIFSEGLAYSNTIDETVVPEVIEGEDLVYVPQLIQAHQTYPWFFTRQVHPYNDKLIVNRYERPRTR